VTRATLEPDLTEQLAELDARLTAAADARLAESLARSGQRLVCRTAGSPCCLGPFEIDALDERRLRRGLAALERADPRRGRALRERARAARAALAPGFPGDAGSGQLGDDDDAIERFLDAHRDRPCPALDASSGLCDLYAARPLSCRSYGPPVSIGGVPLPACPHCLEFEDAAAIERGRVRFDLPEERSARAALPAAERGRRTLVAWAVNG
jgi:Fe-S-cluster containining protein